MELRENVNLKPFNTFGLSAEARYFVEIFSENELIDFLQNHPWAQHRILPLSGGSNMLLTQNYAGVVLKISLMGMEVAQEKEDHVLVNIAAGENWHHFVLWSISKNLGGVENLSLIPGNVGTAPIQNIGAYGVELKDVFHSLRCVEIKTGKVKVFTKDECEFGYRDSIFKRHQKGKYIITQVTLALKKAPHQLKLKYGAIAQQLTKMGIENPSIKEVSDAVIAIRESKLPDPKKIGNSGSFFKNPVIKNEEFIVLKEKFPEAVGYPNGAHHTKVAAGWLIEKAGWKGYRKGDAGVHKNQALVLVNYGNASGKEIQELSSKIQESIAEIFGVNLEAEVNIL